MASEEVVVSEGFEQCMVGLENDVTALQQQLEQSCAQGNGAMDVPADFDPQALLARLEGDMAAERRSRVALNSRIAHLEDSIRHERKSRETQLRGFSSELENTMRSLIGRIDTGLSVGAAAMRERTEATETRLRSLITRVDETLSVCREERTGPLSAGASSQLGAALVAEVEAQTANQSSVAEASNARYQALSSNQAAMSQQLAESFARIREQRLQLNSRQQGSRLREGMSQPMSRGGVSPSMTPSLAIPQTMQVPGSGLQLRTA